MDHTDLEKELAAMDLVQRRMRGLLADIAHVLKGPPRPGEAHDWHDLPDMVARIVSEHKHLKAWWSDHMDKVSAGFEQVAVDLAAVRREAVAEGFRMGATAAIERMEGRLRPLTDPDEVI